MIQITVALPLYRAKNIVFVALESLCRQIDAPEWELLVMEEKLPKAVKIDFINKYRKRLEKANCKKIKYIPLQKWIPLGDKWIRMAKIASGKLFILQSADCYSFPIRLKYIYEKYLENKFDWFQFNSHRVLDLNTMFLYNFFSPVSIIGSDMCMKTSLIKQIYIHHRWKLVDSWLIKQCKLIKPNLEIKTVNNYNWQKNCSINIHGLNNISNRKFNMDGYEKIDNFLIEYIPKPVIEQILQSKIYLKSHKFLRPIPGKFIK